MESCIDQQSKEFTMLEVFLVPCHGEVGFWLEVEVGEVWEFDDVLGLQPLSADDFIVGIV